MPNPVYMTEYRAMAWIIEEGQRAARRNAELPDSAKPVVTRPYVPSRASGREG